MKKPRINVFCLSCVLFMATGESIGQIFVEGAYTWSMDFGYQKDDTQPIYNLNTGQFDRVSTYLHKDYSVEYFMIGIGYAWQKSDTEHSLSVNYNRKGAGGNFRVDIFSDEYAKELLGDILIGHIQFGGYTVDSTDYMFGLYYDNIGLRYGIKLIEKFGFNIRTYGQFDYSFKPRDRIISINNTPNPVTTSGGHRGTKIERETNKYLISVGIEIERPLNRQISLFASAWQSLTSYTKKGEIFSNNTFINTFGLGVRFYQ